MKKFFILLAIVLFAAAAFQAPRETSSVIAVVAVLAAAVFIIANVSRQSRRNTLVPALNTLPPNFGSWKNSRTYFSSAALATRFLLGKFGADKDHIAGLAAASDEPIGVITDEASAADESVAVEFLGLTNRTLPVVAGVAITLGADLYALASGKVGIKPTAAGTYWKVGQALEPADADGDVIAMLPQKPRKLIVVAALESANGALAAASASSATLAPECEKLGDDLRKIAAGLDLNADVALATT